MGLGELVRKSLAPGGNFVRAFGEAGGHINAVSLNADNAAAVSPLDAGAHAEAVDKTAHRVAELVASLNIGLVGFERDVQIFHILVLVAFPLRC